MNGHVFCFFFCQKTLVSNRRRLPSNRRRLPFKCRPIVYLNTEVATGRSAFFFLFIPTQSKKNSGGTRGIACAPQLITKASALQSRGQHQSFARRSFRGTAKRPLRTGMRPCPCPRSPFAGGGQILRNGFSLAALAQQPIKVVNIRGARTPPGLRPQHLEGITMVNRLCGGRLVGAEQGSCEVAMWPQGFTSGDFKVDTGVLLERRHNPPSPRAPLIVEHPHPRRQYLDHSQ